MTWGKALQRWAGFFRRDSLILFSLTAITLGLAALMLDRGATTWLEAASFVTGAICVWLTVRESVWNFPIGIVNEAAFLFVFGRAQLYADAGLQVVYLALTGIGWYLWLYGGPYRTELKVSRALPARLMRVSLAGVVMWTAMYLILRRVGDASPVLDSLTTALSLCAQWLLDRKHIENWWVWIVADVIYIPLYFSRGLTLSAMLYAVFLIMCVIGLREWRRSLQKTSV